MSQSSAGRYGPAATARSRRVTVAAAAIGSAVAAALIVWIGAGVLRDPVQWRDVGFSIQGPDRVEVTFDLIKAQAATVECTVHALNKGFAEVGVIRMTAGPASGRVVRHTVTVATQELAVTGVVDTCRVVPAAVQTARE